MPESWLSADDIAAHLGKTNDTGYTWIAETAMPAHRVDRLWKSQASEIDDRVRAGAAFGADQAPTAHPNVGGRTYANHHEQRKWQG